MLPIAWADEADTDLEEITAYIGQFNPLAADGLWRVVVESVEYLPEHPYMYRRSERVPGCREIVVHPNYVIIYRVGLDHIEVLRVIHTRQQYPS